MSKRIVILLVALSIVLTLTACKVGGKTTVTMEELRNTDLSRVIMPDSILTDPDYCSSKEEFVFIEKAFDPYLFEPIGYRGKDFQRFYIHYDSVRFMGNGVYKVEGRTRYSDTIRLFSGTITLDSMCLYKEEYLPSTGEFGKMYGQYQFDEDEFSGGGVLTGKMSINFAKINGRFYYDAFMIVADGYDNRQYEGVWTSKDLKRLEKCNWGDFRIPDSQGLDIGAGEFSPVDEHSDHGWQVYTYGWAENDSLQSIYQADMQWYTHEEDYVIPYSGRLQRYLKEYGHGKSQPSAKVVLGTIPATMEELNVWYEMGAMENDYIWPPMSDYAHADSVGIMFAYMRMGEFSDGEISEWLFDNYIRLQREHPALFDKYRKQLSKRWNQTFDWWKIEMYGE
ncbi:MAG: hypothetical protein K5890_09555 [Bacteroidales bacterium]|nr:hypothetical protein [Bacteroidales bacterium]